MVINLAPELSTLFCMGWKRKGIFVLRPRKPPATFAGSTESHPRGGMSWRGQNRRYGNSSVSYLKDKRNAPRNKKEDENGEKTDTLQINK